MTTRAWRTNPQEDSERAQGIERELRTITERPLTIHERQWLAEREAFQARRAAGICQLCHLENDRDADLCSACAIEEL